MAPSYQMALILVNEIFESVSLSSIPRSLFLTSVRPSARSPVSPSETIFLIPELADRLTGQRDNPLYSLPPFTLAILSPGNGGLVARRQGRRAQKVSAGMEWPAEPSPRFRKQRRA
jgi:hypothetical protein